VWTRATRADADCRDLARADEQESYFGGDGGAGYSQYESQEAEYLATFREDVRRIAEFVPRGRILEVGCGYGYFLKGALDAGYDAYGIDLSPTAVEKAARQYPGRVFHGRLEELPESRARPST